MNTAHRLAASTVLLCTALSAVPVLGQGLSAEEIVKRSEDLFRGRTSHGIFEMTITTQRWERTLKFEGWFDGSERALIVILAPPKEEGVASLKIGNNMWNYLPNVNRVIKIPPSMMMQSWMGSDFTNDDLVRESSMARDYTATLLNTDSLDGTAAYKLQLIPKPEAAVVWGKLLYWVREEGFVPLRAEYFDEQGDLIRVLRFTEIKRMDDRVIPTVWSMIPRNKEGHKTVIHVIKIHYNVQLDENMFSLRNLRRLR
jgi:outer membrane lipoprotein-sorting protein